MLVFVEGDGNKRDLPGPQRSFPSRRSSNRLEAFRERAALAHEELTDLRGEQLDRRSLLVSIVALIFLPVTFITGLLGSNVQGIPFAHQPWAFWGVFAFCVLIALAVGLSFAAARWLNR